MKERILTWEQERLQPAPDWSPKTISRGEAARMPVPSVVICAVVVFSSLSASAISAQEFAFPRPGFALEMRPLETHQRDGEAFLVVATKQPLDTDTLLGRRADLPIADLLRMLSDLPLSERVEELLVYEVRAK